QRRVLPIIDGLDELADDRRQGAILAINKALISGEPLIVTCRTMEFQAAALASDVITSAAGGGARPIPVTRTTPFLRATIPPYRRGAWLPVFQRLVRDPGSALAQALSTPLMVSLLRAVYSVPSTNPSALLDGSRYPSRASIEHHILNSVTPALMTM